MFKNDNFRDILSYTEKRINTSRVYNFKKGPLVQKPLVQIFHTSKRTLFLFRKWILNKKSSSNPIIDQDIFWHFSPFLWPLDWNPLHIWRLNYQFTNFAHKTTQNRWNSYNNVIILVKNGWKHHNL